MVSEIKQCSDVIPKYLLLVILGYRRLRVLYLIIFFYSLVKGIPAHGRGVGIS